MRKLCLLLLAVITLASCKFLNPEEDLHPRRKYYAYTYRTAGRMTDLCNVYVTYYKIDGTTKTDTVKADALWSKSNYFDKGEIPVGYSVELVAKDSSLFYQKDTTYNFHHYFAYDLSVTEGVWHGQWDNRCEVKCPITKDSLQRLLDKEMSRRGIKFYLNKNMELEEAK